MPFRELIEKGRKRVLGAELAALSRQQSRLHREQLAHIDRVHVALGTLMARNIAGSASSCNDAEFRTFSQFGEDGIIEYLIQRCAITPHTFVEIGVETYVEANTRFLAEHRGWRGLIVDQNPSLSRDLARTGLDWRSQVSAATAYITQENAQSIVKPFVGPLGLGLLSIDIDGVDFWVLEQLLDLEPALIVAEYNALFGDAATVTIPYEPAFDRRRPEHHNIYYGASLAAFDHLLAPQGYSLVACTSSGNNAFFVRSDRLRDVPAQSVAFAYRPRRTVEHRALDGTLTGIADTWRQLQYIRDLPLVNVTNGRTGNVAEFMLGDPGSDTS